LRFKSCDSNLVLPLTTASCIDFPPGEFASGPAQKTDVDCDYPAIGNGFGKNPVNASQHAAMFPKSVLCARIGTDCLLGVSSGARRDMCSAILARRYAQCAECFPCGIGKRRNASRWSSSSPRPPNARYRASSQKGTHAAAQASMVRIVCHTAGCR
jgi:hypothetical protein